MSELTDLILYKGVEIKEIGDYLDNLSFNARLKVVRELGGSAMKSLWQLAESNKVKLTDIVPDEVEPMKPVRHYGKNSLPVFTTFEKRFCRPPDGKVLYGYNEGMTRPFVGPGYFVCHASKGNPRGDVVVDYYMVPDDKPASWPSIVPNTAGLTGIVYGYMHDYLRKVSSDVVIGRAYKHHLETGNYFMLCRQEL